MGQRYWYQEQLRILQTVMRAPDARGYQAEKIVEYLKETDSNCIVVNAGGVLDFFEEGSTFDRKNPYLDGKNLLGELIQRCHEQQIRVIGRVDFRGVEEERYRQHPDWFGLDECGRGEIGWKVLYRPCYNSYYANEYAENFIRRLMDHYEFDGIWENSVGFGMGPCYCKRCRERYRRATGKEIPTGIDYGEEGFREYRLWKAECADHHLSLMRNTVKSYGEEKAYCAEIFGMFHSSNALLTGIDLYNAKRHFDFLVTPAFLDGSADPERKWEDPSSAVFAARFLKAVDPEKQTVILCGNNGTKWRYIKAPSLETRLWMWEIAAEGGGIWNCYFNGQYPLNAEDSRNAYLERDSYRFLKHNEDILKDLLPVSDVGIYYSNFTRDAMGKDKEEEDEYGVFIKGVERVLQENHVPCQFVTDLDFSYDKIKGLKALLLPNAAYLSEEHAEIIRKYVKNGGGIVASYKTSLYDTNNQIREDFLLADLFGCSYTGIEKNTERDSCQLVKRHHDLLKNMDIGSTRMIMNEGNTLLCHDRQEKGMEQICSYVPVIYNQPPECAWSATYETEYPTIMAGNYGCGRVVYFANQTDKLCYTNGHEDFIQTYANAVDWVSRGESSLCTNAPGSVHTHLLKKNDGEYVLSFVNTTMGTVRPGRQLVPIYNIEASLHENCGKLEEWRVLAGEAVKVFESDSGDKKASGNGIIIKIDKLEEFASVYLKTTGGK